ncbi:MAG: hypothetical protein RBT65_16940 [Methanolobus sp.]|nr:hypothetical protein [Methanolobus sp.]
MEELIEKLNIKVTELDVECLITEKGTRAKGAFRWNYFTNQAEILLSNSANEKTKMHEIGHAINFILGKGYPISDTLKIDSEKFADIMADAIETLIKSAKQEKED